MDGSLQQFKELLARRNNRKDRHKPNFDKDNLSYKHSNDPVEYDFPHLTDAELGVIKSRIRENKKREEKGLIILFLIIVLLFTIISYLILL